MWFASSSYVTRGCRGLPPSATRAQEDEDAGTAAAPAPGVPFLDASDSEAEQNEGAPDEDRRFSLSSELPGVRSA